MAGKGSRFAAAGDQIPEYKKPKPLINIKGKPMVRWAIESLPFVDLPYRPSSTPLKVKQSDLVFICLQVHEDEHKISSLLKKTFSNDINIVLIPEVTRGAVETVMVARTFFDSDEDMIVSDSDHYFDGTSLYEAILNKDNDVMGIIPVFQPPDNDPKWSFTLFDKNLNALAVGEKDAELAARGAYANIGGYYFTKGKIFAQEADKMIKKQEMYGNPGKQEFYVAPMYQRLINNGMRVKVAIAPKVWGLGTPSDLEYFLANFKFA